MMTSERLEWLELSSPPEPKTKKTVEPGATPCPACGWPVAAGADACAHCAHSLVREPAGDLPAESKVALPPRIVEMTPAPAAWFGGNALDSPAFYQLRLQAEQLHVTTGFDRLICLDDISVDQYQHQLEAALHALRDMRGRALLADEVGLGKTIEAGIVMKELVERGLVRSILILTPASLTWQWHEEMEAKFHETFEVLENRKQLSGTSDNDYCRWIISLSRAKSARWSKQLLAREYDLLIVDEAHKLKNHRTKVYKFVNQIRKRYVLMLTATPIHNNLMELYNLITILRPGHLGTRQAFRDNFVLNIGGGPKRRVLTWRIKKTSDLGSYLNSAKNVRDPKYKLNSYIYSVKKVEGVDFSLDKLPELPPLSEDKKARISETDVAEFEEIQKELNNLLSRGYRVDYAWLVTFSGSLFSSLKRQLKKKFVGFRIELSRPEEEADSVSDTSKLSPRPEARRRKSRVKRRTAPRNPAALRELLREIMIRNRRSKVGVRFPPRKAAVYYLNLSPPERELYDGVTGYIREQLHQQTEQQGGQTRGSLRMVMMSLQKQLCSSPQAVARTLKKQVERRPDSPLAEYYDLAAGIEEGRKVLAMQTILEQYPAKTLIFTDYLPTLHTLHATLDQAGYETVVFHGGLSSLDRVETVRQFRNSARVMISTQSGSEGHNLQFCHQMINYDLPWNPMRIEQRVGRLHRLGQKETVSIFNLSAIDTIEAYVLDLLAHKIRMFELVIGELDMILGELGRQRGFEYYIQDAWAGSQSEAELLQMIAELEGMLGKAQGTYTEVRDASDELSDLLDALAEVHA